MNDPIATVTLFEDEGVIVARMTDDCGMDILAGGDDAVAALKDLALELEIFIGGAYDALESVVEANQGP